MSFPENNSRVIATPAQLELWQKAALEDDRTESSAGVGGFSQNQQDLSASLKQAESLFQLGLCHVLGDGTAADEVAAASLFKRAGDMGHTLAQFNHALCCSRIAELPDDAGSGSRAGQRRGDDLVSEMIKYYQLAAGPGLDPVAMAASSNSTGWRTQDFSGNLMSAHYNLGWCYDLGFGVPRDLDK